MFQGFNFDDDGFGRRGDFRAHLDDLASRHPEFADHLLGTSWGDIPFHGSLRNRRRGSSSGNNYQDEDTKSQASGSSAASGASAVSSHGEPESSRQHFQEAQEPKRNYIPKYGLRNTVDIGQHRMNMENPEKVNRNQRSMSAPPENRQQPQKTDQPQRFVSRVEITPQQQQQQQQQQAQQQEQPQREKSPGPQPQQTQQQKTQQQTNVRHIPIFVEGRDEPVIPKNVDDVPFPGQSPPPPHFQNPPQYQHPPQYQTPPTFHRPSHFNERFGRQNWHPQFQESFFDQPQWEREGLERPFKREWPQRESQHQKQPQQQQNQKYQQQQQHPNQQQKHPQYQQQHPQNQQQNHPHHQPQNQQQKQEPEAPKPKPTLPKDPLERVALVQKEVDSLTEQVKNYKGDSRKDKAYIYLDEMLTRELIKLDDIETEGKENVRKARRTAIKSIQDSINLLESKVPLPGQLEVKPPESETEESVMPQETMETEQPEEAHNDKPIPLPPGPNSTLKEENHALMEQVQEIGKESHIEGTEGQVETKEAGKAEPGVDTTKAQVDSSKEVKASQYPESVESNLENKNPTGMEVQTESENKKENVSQMQVQGSQEEQQPKAAKSSKKVKKTKKQPDPVSKEAIPLPPPNSDKKGTK